MEKEEKLKEENFVEDVMSFDGHYDDIWTKLFMFMMTSNFGYL